MDIEEIRKDFPILQNKKMTYLDSGATTQKPNQVIKAVQEFYEKYNANPHRGAYSLSMEATEIYENTRTKIANFINEYENCPYEKKPVNLHQKYKIKAEKYIRKKLENHIILRTGILRNKNYSTIEQKVKKFLKLSPYIMHFGKWNGANRLLFSDVKNVSDVILACVLSDEIKNKVINVSDKKFTSVDEYYSEIALKYFPKKRFKRIFLPLFAGKLAGWVSTFISKCLDLRHPLFEPTLYFLYFMSSSMDFSNKKCDEILNNFKLQKEVSL